MMHNPFASNDQKVWKWFKQHSNELKAAEVNGQLMEEFQELLGNIDTNLAFEISPEDESGSSKLTITCNGMRESIQVVKDLVADAPDVKGWQFEAFRQAIPESVALETDTFKLSTDDLKFSYQNSDDDRVDIIIYVNGLNEANRENYTQAAFILFDAAAGELLIMEKINKLDVSGATVSEVNIYDLLEIRRILVR